MIPIGNLALWLALAVSLYGVGASLYGAARRRRDFVASGEHAGYATFGLVVIATAVLLNALINNDFRLKYVAGYTSTSLPLHYRITALWGGMEGSLLFWALILSTLGALVVWQNRDRNRELMPYVTATVLTVSAFFLGLLTFLTPPLETLAFTPAEGTDLNPLLQNYWMQIHPPSLNSIYEGGG